MKLRTAFKKSLLPSLIGLLAGGYIASAMVIFLDSMGDSNVGVTLANMPGTALMFSTYALMFSFPAMLLIAWPCYANLLSKGQANYLTSTYVPAIFCLLAGISISVKFSIVVAIYAVTVAWIAHWLQMRSDKLFASNPQQGGA